MPSRGAFYLKTMGCQMNEHDSEVITGILTALHFESCSAPDEADIILYNTCCVRENPERKVYGHLTRFKELKKKNPQLIIGICGCMTQQKEELNDLLARLPHVDLIFGTHNIHRLPELLERAQSGERVVEVFDEASGVEEDLPVRRFSTLKAFVNVIYGCTNFCSYCVVPYTRGRERSRTPESIEREVRALASQGYKEITLLGQNVNAYGKDLAVSVDFADLLTSLDAVPELLRIRFTTSHPRDMTAKLIQGLSVLDKVCNHLHLPVQSGSSAILQRMNRGYTRDGYLRLVEQIRRAVPDISLTTDLIVGFPGETDKDFSDTLDLVRQVEYSSAFTFMYSPRKGTPAAAMPDQVIEGVKKERIYKLIELQNTISARQTQRLVGETLEVLVEDFDDAASEAVGRTMGNRQVRFAAPKTAVGCLMEVCITSAQTFSLYGRPTHAV